MTLLSKKKAENDTSVFSNNQNDTSDPPNVTSVCKMTLLSLILVHIEKLIWLGKKNDTSTPPNVTSVFEMTLLSPNYQTMVI